jgi:glycosyltransferase involved in cell wall biosynthesis
LVIGDGPDFNKVKQKAGPNVKILGFQQGDILKEYMQKARAFVFAAEEDFGIIPVEAQACGTPIIAYGRGGATETVVPLPDGTEEAGAVEGPPTGVFFYEQTTASLIEAVQTFEANRSLFNPEEIRENSERFSVERFRKEFREFVELKAAEFFR